MKAVYFGDIHKNKLLFQERIHKLQRKRMMEHIGCEFQKEAELVPLARKQHPHPFMQNVFRLEVPPLFLFVTHKQCVLSFSFYVIYVIVREIRAFFDEYHQTMQLSFHGDSGFNVF